MLEPTTVTWALVIFGVVAIFLPVLYAQVLMVTRPDSQATKDLLIGKGDDWRDKTHFRSALGYAWADFLVWFPTLLAGSVGILLGHHWGYVLWGASGVISVYINVVFWFSEREYVYPIDRPVCLLHVFLGVLCLLGSRGHRLFRLASRMTDYHVSELYGGRFESWM